MNKNRSYKLLFIYFLIAIIIRGFYMWNIGSLDEGIYLTVSNLMLEGKTLYLDVPESKPPVFFYILASAIKVLGNNIELLRIFVIFIAAGTATILYKITEDIYNEKAGILAGLLFITFSSLPLTEGFFILTEPFVVFMESVVLFLVAKLCYGTVNKKLYYIFIGIFLAFSILIRQTALLFLFFIITFLIISLRSTDGSSSFKNKNDPSEKFVMTKYILIGFGGVLSVIFLTFYINGGIDSMVYWLLYQPLEHITTTTTDRSIHKLEWFMVIFKTTLPLWILTSISLFMKQIKLYSLFIFIWGLTLVAFLKSSFLPGFPHEYNEILLPLSINGGIGGFLLLGSLKDLLINKNGPGATQIHKFTKPILIGLTILILSSIYISSAQNIQAASDYKTSQDMKYIHFLSSYLSQYTSRNESVYIFETIWPRIGLEVYFESQRYPPLNQLFYFPSSISQNESTNLINALERDKTPYIVIIGVRPEYKEARKIYDYILSNYRSEVNAGNYSPYPWAPDQPVTIYKRKVIK